MNRLKASILPRSEELFIGVGENTAVPPNLRAEQPLRSRWDQAENFRRSADRVVALRFFD